MLGGGGGSGHVVLINLDSLPEANSPNTKHVYHRGSGQPGSWALPGAAPGLVEGTGAGCVSVINRFQSGYFGKENFSGTLKSFHQPSASVLRPSARPWPLTASESFEFPGSCLRM